MQGDLNIKYKVRYNEQRVNRGDDTLESWNNPLKVINHPGYRPRRPPGPHCLAPASASSPPP